MSLVQYTRMPLYNFPAPEKFHGDSWYNPYQHADGTWYKSNFHAHSVSWLGMTDGRNHAAEVHNHYKQLGYDIIGISDYQHIDKLRTKDDNFIPVYEHGFNVSKCHHVVIGAKRVEWQDYVFFQSRHHKQHILDELSKNSEFVAIAHPLFCNGYDSTDMAALTHYNAIEVLNHYRKSVSLWDDALSAGRPVWIIGDDDTHKISDPGQTGVCWTMVMAASPRQDDVIAALKQGRMFGVEGKHAIVDNTVLSVSVQHNQLRIECDKPADQIRFIGQFGALLKTVDHDSIAVYSLQDSDTYIRTEIQNAQTTFYLNPILRCQNGEPQIVAASVNQMATWIMRGGAILIVIMVSYLVQLISLYRKTGAKLIEIDMSILQLPLLKQKKYSTDIEAS